MAKRITAGIAMELPGLGDVRNMDDLPAKCPICGSWFQGVRNGGPGPLQRRGRGSRVLATYPCGSAYVWATSTRGRFKPDAPCVRPAVSSVVRRVLRQVENTLGSKETANTLPGHREALRAAAELLAMAVDRLAETGL